MISREWKKNNKKNINSKKNKKNRRLHPANNSNYHGWFTQGAIFGAWQQQESWMRDVRCWWEKFCRLVVVAQLPAGNMAAACRRIRVWEINMLIGIGLSGSARWVWLFMNRHAEAWCGNNVTPAGSVKVVWMLRGAAGAVSGGIQPDRRSPQSHRGRNPNYRCALDSYHDLKNIIGTFTPLTWTSATSKATSFRRVKCNSTATSLILDWVSVWLKSLQITSKSPKEKGKKHFSATFDPQFKETPEEGIMFYTWSVTQLDNFCRIWVCWTDVCPSQHQKNSNGSEDNWPTRLTDHTSVDDNTKTVLTFLHESYFDEPKPGWGHSRFYSMPEGG